MCIGDTLKLLFFICWVECLKFSPVSFYVFKNRVTGKIFYMWLALYFFCTALVGRIKICLEVRRTLAKRQTKVFCPYFQQLQGDVWTDQSCDGTIEKHALLQNASVHHC